MQFVLIAIAVIIIILLVTNIHVVQQSRAFVVERLGGYHATWGVGLHVKVPILDRIAKRVSLKEQVVDFAPQPVITKDNVTMQIDTVIYFQIVDPKLYTYGVEQPLSAIENLTATTLRNIIGDLELDQSLTSRDHINTQMRAILDEATDPWGIKVNRVELKNIMPPKDIQESMEKQMRAERERREAILQAEGQKQSQILVAEGEKQSAILRADAAKQAAILEAEGKAQAILKVQQATADALRLLNEAAPNDQVVKLKALEAFQAAADGRATKIIIPSEIQSLAGLGAGIAALVEPEQGGEGGGGVLWDRVAGGRCEGGQLKRGPDGVAGEQLVVRRESRECCHTELHNHVVDKLLSLLLCQDALLHISLDIDVKECGNTSHAHCSSVLCLDRCTVSEVPPLNRLF